MPSSSFLLGPGSATTSCVGLSGREPSAALYCNSGSNVSFSTHSPGARCTTTTADASASRWRWCRATPRWPRSTAASWAPTDSGLTRSTAGPATNTSRVDSKKNFIKKIHSCSQLRSPRRQLLLVLQRALPGLLGGGRETQHGCRQTGKPGG